jgi:hypothetical protein
MGWLKNLLGQAEVDFSQNGHGPRFGIDIPFEIVQGDRLAGLVAGRISRKDALEVPAVLRSRNLIAGTLARLPIHVRDKARVENDPTGFLAQVDPDVANVVTFASTYEDLLFEAVSWWKVTAFGWRSYPINAVHVPVNQVMVSSGRVYINGLPVADNEVIRFDSPNPPMLVHAARAIRTCLLLDKAAAMYADSPVPLGHFTPKEGAADLPREQIQALLDEYMEGTRKRAWTYVSGAWDAKKMQFDAEQIQLADQRQHAVLEIARAAGVDPEDLGVSTTSRTYQNSEQRRQDLLDFTLAAYVAAVEQRLSMKDVLPRGYAAKVNFDAFLRSDTKTRMETYAIGAPLGVYTEDERRELEDRPALTPAQKAELVPEPQPMEPVNE